jgi:hypothetical protein
LRRARRSRIAQTTRSFAAYSAGVHLDISERRYDYVPYLTGGRPRVPDTEKHTNAKIPLRTTNRQHYVG